MPEKEQNISIKGKRHTLPAIQVGEKAMVVVRGGIMKTASLHDEFWLESKDIPDPLEIVAELQRNPVRPDLFTFAQKFPDISPSHPYYLEWDNLAVAEFGCYGDWYKKINQGARYSIKKSVRENVRTEVVPFTDELVQGIYSIYNETPVRQGKKFWHYGKDYSEVKSENSSYVDRSAFIGAYQGSELIGFAKLVFSGEVAAIMQMLSKVAHFHNCPTNALLAEAVDTCESKGVRYLIYAEYDYGKNRKSGLTEFKRNNGFVKIDIPRYFIPLTVKGRMFLALHMHKGVEAMIPAPVWSWAIALRKKWYELKNRR